MNIVKVCGILIKLILFNCLNADEATGRECSGDWLDCGNEVCVAKIWLCDHDNDCGNGKDEENCEGVFHPQKCVSSQFQCKSDGHCIPETWRCDGEKDCSDESDEKACASLCKDMEFRCSSGSCINSSQVCDRRKDCSDGSDEGTRCGYNCSNTKCSQKCRNTPDGPECYCSNGYDLQKDGKTCLDIDECLVDGFCSHHCENFEGGYKCSCFDGYELMNRTCKAKGSEPLLIFSTPQEIRGLHLRSKNYFLIHKAIAKSAAIDADPINQRVYWIEITDKSSIYSSKFDGSGVTTVRNNGLMIPEDVAVDYIGRNLYITDSGLKHVLACKMDATLCIVLHDTDTDKLRAIALDPSEGLLYWSDWGAETAGIYRSGMDGSQRVSMVSSNISWPNGIALDHSTDRLYWTDALLQTIEFITLDGKTRKVLIKDRVYHPYSLTVFEDNLYWTDWTTFSLDSCNKFTGRKVTLLTRENGKHIIGVHIYHPVLVSKVENPCWSHTCSHMCVLAPARSFSCLCPSGYMLSSDNRTCRNGNCGANEFRCLGSPRCILMEHRCDGIAHCQDGSDEHCDEHFVRCPGNDFQCKNGRCIILSWKCDHRDDCGDNSDEEDCPVRTSCTANQFSCGDAHCIPTLWRCDGEDDCKDGRDERNCHETVCNGLHLRCDSGQCIPESWVCDGASDCIDNTDERDCVTSTSTCSVTQFRCEDGTCIDKTQICDKRSDCQDGSDEKNCSLTPTKLRTCNATQFRCNDGICVNGHEVCDGYKDCSHGEDESECSIRACVYGEYQCPSSKRCISMRYVCDGNKDCDDGSDEDINNCTKNDKITASPPSYAGPCEGFYCSDSGKCLPWFQVCDGRRDCDYLPDEGGMCLQSCRSHGCSQVCMKTPRGPKCGCYSGYVLMTDGKTCEDVNECVVAGRCSHFCDNTRGGFKCSCAEGYDLEHDQRRCKAEGGSATLMYLLKKEMRGFDLESHTQKVYISGGSQDMRGMDFDADDRKLFWAAFDQESINSFTPDSMIQNTLVKDPLKAIFIKWDWIAKNMYFTDSVGSIKVCNKNGKHCATLIHRIAVYVNTLAISPPNGVMFWGVWGAVFNEEHGFIDTAELDGSHRKRIITDVIGPTAITVDEILKVIFWADCKLSTLEYADFQGFNRKQVLAGVMYYPFSMTIFEDFVFWADWGTNAIMRCNKFTGKECIQFHKGDSLAEDMMVVHRVKQPKGVNRCAYHNCPHLCLPTRSNFSCKCSDHYTARNNSCQLQTTTRPTYKQKRTPKVSCPESYCANDGICAVEYGKFICMCSDGFAGKRCDIKTIKESHSSAWSITVTYSILVIALIIVIYVLHKRDNCRPKPKTETVRSRYRTALRTYYIDESLYQ